MAQYFDHFWVNHKTIPMLSYYPPLPNSLVAAGHYDQTHIAPLVAAVKDFLSGPDDRLGTGDDRRVYMRYAWEPNSGSFGYSPCSGNGEPASTYISAWRHVHGLFRDAGVDSSRMAWVFSVINFDSGPQCSAEALYPGSEYVDWLGYDAYSVCGQSVVEALDPMYQRLRAIDPTKPIGINEVGVSSFLGVSFKNAWITDYWNYLSEHDVRMSVWFNSDKGSNPSCADFEKPWAFYGRTHGDTTQTSCFVICFEEKGFSAYRTAIQQPWVIGSDASNIRLLTDSQFLGR